MVAGALSRLFRSALLGLVLSAATAPPALAVATLQPVTQVEGVSEYRLANGLRVLLLPDQSRPTTTVNLTYLVGSRHESYGETGMAHLLEHLLFKGTPKNPDIDSEFTRRGMMSNATTWFDRTNYFETFSAGDDNLRWALQMEADRMLNAGFGKRELDSEMPVVRNEMEGGENDGFTILLQRMAASAYQWHNYGKDTIGARSDVERVQIPRLRAFYKRYYQPDNAVLAIAGRFDQARTLQWVSQYFGALTKPARVLERTYTEEPVQDGEREVTLRRVGDTYLLAALYHVSDGAHPDSAAISLLEQVLGGTPNGRLHRRLVESKLASEISAMHYALAEPGYLLLAAKTGSAADVGKIRGLLLQTIEGIASEPITQAELDSARAAWLNQFDKTVADPNLFAIALSDAIARGDWRLFFLERDRVEQLQPADLQRAALNYLLPSNRTFGQFIPDNHPQRSAIPARSEPQRMVQGYVGKPAPTQGELFDSSPANIEARLQREQLPEGLQLVLLPKRNRADQVTLALQLHFGDEHSLSGRDLAGEAAAAMLLRGAFGQDRGQIASELDRLRTKLSINGDAQGVSVSLQTTKSNLPAALGLLGNVLRRPTFSSDEFEQLRSEWLTQTAESRNDPTALGHNMLARQFDHYPPGDVRHVRSFDEQLADIGKLKLSEVREFHRDFYGASAGQLVLIGDVDSALIRRQLAATFGDWRARLPYRRVPQPYQPSGPASLKLATPDKANAWFSAALQLPLSDRSPDYPALLLANYVFGQGGGLNSRLMLRLRQQEGLSYGAGSSFAASADEPRAGWEMSATAAPQNFARLQSAFEEEFQRWIEHGISQQELDDARSGLLQEMALARSDDTVLAEVLLEQQRLGRRMTVQAELEARLQVLTPTQVNTALQRNLAAVPLLRVAAGDWSKLPREGNPVPPARSK